MERGSKMTIDQRARVSRARMGNQNRKGIPHTEEIKHQIGESLKTAYTEGRHRLVPPTHRTTKTERNEEWVSLLASGQSFAAIARRDGLDPSGVRKTILAHIRRRSAAE